MKLTCTDKKSTSIIEGSLTVLSCVGMELISLHPSCKIILDISFGVLQFLFTTSLSMLGRFVNQLCTEYISNFFILDICGGLSE